MAGFRPVPTSIDHGTVTVVAAGKPHEVTTFRRDVETDGRRAVVAYSTEIQEDAQRRDFTMNALYADRRGQVIDPLNGLPDLLARRVRFVGDAETRIREDYLRILRFFRFHAAYGDPESGLDADGLAACATFSAGLETISKERIYAELKKLLAARDPAPAVAAMAQSGVLALVLPAPISAPLPRWCISNLQNPRAGSTIWPFSAVRRMTSRLSRAEARDLAALRNAIGSAGSAAVLGWQLGETLATDAVLARAAVLGSPPPPEWRADVSRRAQARFPVTAADLMPDHTGVALGERLKALPSHAGSPRTSPSAARTC